MDPYHKENQMYGGEKWARSLCKRINGDRKGVPYKKNDIRVRKREKGNNSDK